MRKQLPSLTLEVYQNPLPREYYSHVAVNPIAYNSMNLGTKERY